MFWGLVLIIAALLYYWGIRTFDYWKKRKIPFVKPTVFFGNILPFVRNYENYHNVVDRIYKSLDGKSYGGYFEMRVPVLMVRNPNLVTMVAVKNFNNFHDRSVDFMFNPENKILNPLSSNLFSTKGEHWRTTRQRMSPAFTSNKLNVMYEQIANCVSNLDKLVCSASNLTVDFRGLFMNYTIDVIGSTAFGISCSSLENYGNSKFGQMARKAFFDNGYPLRFLMLTIHKKLVDIFKISDLPVDVSNFFSSIIHDTIQFRKEANIRRKDFLQMLIDLMNEKRETNYDEFTELDVASNAFIFFAAGFETTATTMGLFMYEIALNKEIQEKVRNEIEDVKKQHNGQITIESLKELNYIDMVISETLRKYPPIAALFRVCTKAITIPDTDIVIEKGTKVVIPTQSLHHDPLYFPDPEKFDPERFSPDNKSKICPGSYLPFGEGPRYCIGMRFAQIQMKMALALLVSKYRISPSEKTDIPLQMQTGVPILMPKNGILLNVERIM